MSKRFGRNQKRAYRERIAALEQQLGAERRAKQKIERVLHAREEQLDQISRNLGRYCAMLPAEEIEMLGKPLDHVHVVVSPAANWAALLEPGVDLLTRAETCIALTRLVAEVKPDLLGRHVLVRFGQKEVAYYMDERAMYLAEPEQILKTFGLAMIKKLQTEKKGKL